MRKGLDILKSYLLNQYQYIKLANIESAKRKISGGVPQGSILGLLLFIYYVNDFPLASYFRLFCLQVIFAWHCLTKIYYNLYIK